MENPTDVDEKQQNQEDRQTSRKFPYGIDVRGTGSHVFLTLEAKLFQASSVNLDAGVVRNMLVAPEKCPVP